MIVNYFKIAWRNLSRNKKYSAINILGLALGMTACFFIFQYVTFENSYDKFNKNAQNIYRVPISYTGSLSDGAASLTNHPPLGPALKRDIPEVVEYCRLLSFKTFCKSSYMTYQEGDQKKSFFENDIYFRAGYY